MIEQNVEQLARLAAAYRKAEVGVVKAFFERPRSSTDHVLWLKAQAFKEYSAIKPLIAALAALHTEIDHGIDRHRYAELTEKLADETRHARLVMDLLEEITGKKITPGDLTWLPEDRKLARVRAKYSKSYAALLHGSKKISSGEIARHDEELERAAITLTEGGGGALYQVCAKLKKTGIERKIAAVFREILRDEVGHKESGARELAFLIRSQTACDRAVKIICDVSQQRLRMRNEQFGFPLAASQLAALDVMARRSIA